MTSNMSYLMQQAHRGNVTAIAALLNQSLQNQNLTATIERQNLSLRIVITGDRLPDPAIVERLQRGLMRIRPALAKEAVIYGQRSGDLLPQWSETVGLVSPAVAAESETSSNKEELSSSVAEQRAALQQMTANRSPDPPPRSQVELKIPRLLAWDVGTLACLLIPFLNLFALMVFVLGIRPLALQEGTVWATKSRWKLPYASAFGMNLVVMILTTLVYQLVAQPMFPNSPILRWMLYGLAEIGLYAGMLRFPFWLSLGFWHTCGAVMVMEVFTGLPLIVITWVLDELLTKLERFLL